MSEEKEEKKDEHLGIYFGVLIGLLITIIIKLYLPDFIFFFNYDKERSSALLNYLFVVKLTMAANS